MALDEARDFFTNVVRPTVTDFLAHISDQRLGCLACLVLSSMADHYFYAHVPPVEGHLKAGNLRFALGETNWAYKQIAAVANATKHVVRRDKRLGYGDIQVRQITLGLMRCGWPMNGPAVLVETEPGTFWLLSQLVESAVAMWREKLGMKAENVDE